MTQVLVSTVSTGLPPAMPVYRLTWGQASGWGTSTAGTVVEASMNWLPNTTWYSQNRITKAMPIVTMAAFMPMIWLRWVSLTSPVNEMARTARDGEKAGQREKKAVCVRLKCGVRLLPALRAELMTFW